METPVVTPVHRIAVIGGYTPRQCGIATFSTHLCESLQAQFPNAACFAVPVTDDGKSYDYPDEVRFEIAQNDLASYKSAADFLNANEVDIVCLQHEYGIFGGACGSHILTLMRELQMPIVTVLHTILEAPDVKQQEVLQEVCRLSERVVAMTKRGSDFLQSIYGVPQRKIDIIPHGIPDTPFVDPNYFKESFEVAGRTVALTFGLLSQNKGIEYVIKAMPRIVSDNPDFVYMVLGATHPHVIRNEGEAYRESLRKLAVDLGVGDNVIFHNQFVTQEELVEFIGAADIYITPYLNKSQIASGTLAYAVGMGKAVVSTPYWHAEELLEGGYGSLVPFADSEAIADTIIDLLEDEPKRHAMRRRAFNRGREMTWSRVAHRYMESFSRSVGERLLFPRVLTDIGMDGINIGGTLVGGLPTINLAHLFRMTDDTAMLQHSIFTVPNYSEGYTTDDNARALITCVMLEQAQVCRDAVEEREVEKVGSRYLAFLWHAFNTEAGRFRNFMSYERKWLEEIGSDDSHARALWALGTVVGRSENVGWCRLARHLFDQSLSSVLTTTSPRAWSYAILGTHEYLSKYPGDRRVAAIQNDLASRLLQRHADASTADWDWFEDMLTYANPVLSQALLLAGKFAHRQDMIDVGLQTLRWLKTLQTSERRHFIPIGSNGFHTRGSEPARYDQQPIEAHANVCACLEAYALTNNPEWKEAAQTGFEWFHGRNDLRLALYDSVTGGCQDGLHPDCANKNQGAESTLAYLMTALEMRILIDSEQPVPIDRLNDTYEDDFDDPTIGDINRFARR